ncbi:insulinase family protein [Streptomyces tauricus]|uniref:Insulinase family protein n=1 Tax=Streptomyces tauricus TaxID=68274 RepID=A0ABZ1JRX3_9ACTN|nr:pitrilysin family protein [Streptomyces tauricus]
MLVQDVTNSAIQRTPRTASICLTLDMGARDDPANASGLAHLLEHALMAGPVQGKHSLSEFVERAGGRTNAETGLERMLFYAQVLAEDLDEVTDLLIRAVITPEFDGDILSAERAVVARELDAAAADPADVVQDAFLASLFPRHPLGRPVGGTTDSVRDITGHAVRAHHDLMFSSRRTAIAVAGPRAPRIDLAGPAIRAGGTAARVAAPLGPVHHEEIHWPAEYSWVCVGGRSAAAGSAERSRYEVLAALCGASPFSPLYRTLRNEHGLAYSFQSWHRGYTEAGAWRVLIGTDAAHGPAVVELVTTVLRELAERGPSSDDLHAAHRQVCSALVFDTEDPLEHARRLATGAVTGEPFSTDADTALVRAVTREDISRTAQHILRDLVVTVRPRPTR